MITFTPIPSFEDRYAISESGLVFSKKKNIILKPYKINSGYMAVALYKDSKASRFTVHRLVALTFLGGSELQVNHINGNKLDNSLKNLEYLSRADNMRHAHTRKKGVSKLGAGRFRASLWLDGKNVHLGVYPTRVEAYKAYKEIYIKTFNTQPW